MNEPPASDLVVKSQPDNRRKYIMLGTVSLVAILLVGLGAYTYYTMTKPAAVDLSSNGTHIVRPAKVSGVILPDSSINSAIDTIDGSYQSSATDNTDADNALSDSQHQISVPTE